MKARILVLDDSLASQPRLLEAADATLFLQDQGPRLRLGCAHRAFRRFERLLTRLLGSVHDHESCLTFFGSGDFHHVSLALLRRQPEPCNLLVLDNHPDWMRGIPFLHCGTWLHHAARLPQVERIFHVGGDVDFDNAYRWLAPWPLLRSGKITVLPARRSFQGRRWRRIPHEALRTTDTPVGRERIDRWLEPFRAELGARPLYISLDKDVMTAQEAVVNWDSGHLASSDVLAIVEAFVAAADGEVAGMDVVGDWSPVWLRGLLRRALSWLEHPALHVEPEQAARRNEELNLLLRDHIYRVCAEHGPRPVLLPWPGRDNLRRSA